MQEIEGFKITPKESMDANSDGSPINPFNQDTFHMGTFLGTNLAAMFRNLETEDCEYLILINRKTGKRIKIEME